MIDSKEALKQVQAGTLALHRLESVLPAGEAVAVRRQFIAARSAQSLDELAPLPFGVETVQGKNIENLIGSVSLPVGVAGPITVNGAYAKGSFYVPLATTEGALVASINRGCKLLSEAGGVTTSLQDNGMTRAPLFEAKNLAEAQKLRDWVQEHETDLVKTAEATSGHLKWLGVDMQQAGRLVWLRMRFNTGEAMGMNMATIAAQSVSELICKQTGVQLLALSGNLCVDKKPNYQNIVAGRGFSVQAEAYLSADLIERIIQTDYKRLARIATAKNWYGGGMSGSIGANAQAANVVAAIFMATGQDGGHIVDSSTCFTVCEVEKNGLYISVSLPTVLVGSVGGGTGLPQQSAAHKLMTAALTGKTTDSSESRCLAEVLAATVLAGELSLLGALAADQLTAAHQKLGRAGK